MPNHYHLVLHANEDICVRCYQLNSATEIVSRWRKGEFTCETEINVALEVTA